MASALLQKKIDVECSPNRKYHSIGFFGEQALESLHQIMHKDETKFVHLNKQPVKKIKLCSDHQIIRQAIKNKNCLAIYLS